MSDHEYESGYDEPQDAVLVRSAVDRKFRKFLDFTTLGMAALSVATLVSVYADPTEEISEYEGKSQVVHISGQSSMPIVDDVNVFAGGDAKHDVSFAPDSRAHERGVYVQDIEYFPSGSFRLDAFEDDKIGFYILMSEFDGNGAVKEFDYSNVEVTTQQPVACNFEFEEDVSGNHYADPTDDCTTLINNDPLGWHGIEDAGFAKGGFLGTRLDDTPPGIARTMTDEFLNNTRCNLGLRFGTTSEQKAQWQPFNIPAQMYNVRDVYEGVRKTVIARYRKKASDIEQLPLADTNGRPFAITETERDFLLLVAEKHKPIHQMTAEEYGVAVTAELELLDNRLVPRGADNTSIEIGQPVAKDLIELQRDYPTMMLDRITTDDSWLERGGDTFSFDLNYNCIPHVPELLEEFKLEHQMIDEIGGLVGLMPGATLVVDEEKVSDDEFIEEIYLFAGANNYFTKFKYALMPESQIDARVAVYKYEKGMDLTDQDIAILNSLRAQQAQSQTETAGE